LQDGPVDHSNQDCSDDGFSEETADERLYVDDDAQGLETGLCWENAYRDLVDALERAAEPNSTIREIWVAQGIYRPDRGTMDRQRFFQLPSGVAIYGGFMGYEERRSQRNPDPATNGTVLSGDLLGDDGPDWAWRADNSFHVVVADGVAAGTILDGFTIRGGFADGMAQEANDRGAGVLARGSSLLLRNVLLIDNYATLGGGAYLGGGAPQIEASLLQNNRALDGGALYIAGGGAPALRVTDFLLNEALGTGGSVCVTDSAAPTFQNCRFLANTAGTGGAVAHAGQSQASLFNCLFSANTADTGGAIAYLDSAIPLMSNATLYGNHADVAGGGLAVSMNSAPVIRNTIVWGNTDAIGGGESGQIAVLGGAAPYIDYCCVEGWTGALGGEGNFGSNPLLDETILDTSNGFPLFDLHLLEGSPCIDAGNNIPLSPLMFALSGTGQPVDLEGNPRFLDDPQQPDTGAGQPPLIDLGAYEFVCPTTPSSGGSGVD